MQAPSHVQQRQAGIKQGPWHAGHCARMVQGGHIGPSLVIFRTTQLYRVADLLELISPASKLSEQAQEMLLERFLTDEALRTPPAKSRAAIIDIFALLNLGDERAAAMPALDEAGKREETRLGADVSAAPLVKRLLDRAPDVGGHKGFVHPGIKLASPFKSARVRVDCAEYHEQC